VSALATAEFLRNFRPLRQVVVDAWGGAVVYVRCISGAEWEAIQRLEALADVDQLVHLAAVLACNHEGHALYGENDYEVLRHAPIGGLKQVVEEGLQLNGIDPAAVEGAAGN